MNSSLPLGTSVIPPAHVQGGVVEGSGTTVTLTLGAVGSGNLVCGQVAFVSSGVSSVLISDNKGNSYNVVDLAQASGFATLSFYLGDITNAPTSISVTFNTSVAFSSIIADEFSGVATTSPLDLHLGQTQTPAPSGLNGMTTGVAMTQYNAELVYGVAAGPGTPTTTAAGVGFFLLQSTTDGEHSEYCIQSVPGIVGASFTLSASGNAWMQAMTFKPKSAPSGSNNFFAADGASSPVNASQTSFYKSNTNTTWFSWQAWEQVGGTYQRVVMVTTFNHTTQTWSSPVIAGTSNALGANDQHGVATFTWDQVTDFVYLFYDCHNTNVQISYTTVAGNPSAWTASSLSGTFTFPIGYAIGGKIYLFWNGTGSGTSTQESLKVVIATINASTGALTFGSPVTLVDTGGTTWLLAAWSSVQINSTEVGFFLEEGPTFPTGNTPNSYFIVYDTATGNVTSVGGGTVVVPASQPVSLATLNSSFAVYSNTSLWVLRVAVDGGGTIRCFIVDFSVAVPVLYETHWTGSAWSSPFTVYTFPSNSPGNIAAVVNASGGIDIYFTDGSFPNLAPDWYVAGGGNLLRRTVSLAGAWDSGPITVFKYTSYPIFGMNPVVGASAGVRLAFGESSLIAQNIAGNLRVYALGDNGLVTHP